VVNSTGIAVSKLIGISFDTKMLHNTTLAIDASAEINNIAFNVVVFLMFSGLTHIYIKTPTTINATATKATVIIIILFPYLFTPFQASQAGNLRFLSSLGIEAENKMKLKPFVCLSTVSSVTVLR
jgi:hypothetical protein